MNAKIAIACDNGRVAEHFGRCENFLILEVKDGRIVSERVLAAPEHVQGAFPKFLAEQGVDMLICCGIGPKALELMQHYGIEVIAGIEGDIASVIEMFLKNELRGSKPKCEHL